MADPRYLYFLAHASPDKDYVRDVYRALMAAPHPAADPDEVPAFFDEASIPDGKNWDLVLPVALAHARAVVVFVSRRYNAAWFLREEVQRAIHYARDPANAMRLIPVYLDGWPRSPAEAPYGLYTSNAIDATALSPAALADRLIRGAGKVPEGAPPAPPSPPPITPADDETLYEAACALLPAQLEKLLKLTLKAPVHELRHATRSEQVVDVITWANLHPPLRVKLEAELRRLAPARFHA